MIRVAKSLKTLLLKPDGLSEDAWKERLRLHDCVDQPLLIETVGARDVPMCPRCFTENNADFLPAGAGLSVCWNCCQPYVALRFVGDSRGELWCSFPWPE